MLQSILQNAQTSEFLTEIKRDDQYAAQNCEVFTDLRFPASDRAAYPLSNFVVRLNEVRSSFPYAGN